MARTALRSPSTTAFERGEAIIFMGSGVERERAKTKARKGRRRAETWVEVKATWRWCNKL